MPTWLITQRSRVQIPPPLPRSRAPSDHGRGLLCAVCKRIGKRYAAHAAVPASPGCRIKAPPRGAARMHGHADTPRTCKPSLRRKGAPWCAGCPAPAGLRAWSRGSPAAALDGRVSGRGWPGCRESGRWWAAARPTALALGRTARAAAAAPFPRTRHPPGPPLRTPLTRLPERPGRPPAPDDPVAAKAPLGRYALQPSRPSASLRADP